MNEHPASTIAVLRNGSGMDLDRYVVKTFTTAETAYRWANRQDRNVTIRVLEGRYKVGQRVPFNTPAKPLA